MRPSPQPSTMAAMPQAGQDAGRWAGARRRPILETDVTDLPAQPDAAGTRSLLQPWPGPFGGLPPFDQATPDAIEQAFHAALAIKRAELRAIAANPEPPSFDNTLAAWEDSGRALCRVQKVSGVMAQLASSGDMPAVAQRIAPLALTLALALALALNDEIARDAALFARIFSVNLDFLAPAIVDIKAHLAATGAEVDATEIERQTLAELGMPAAWDQIMRVTHNMHCFSANYSDGYAAGLYSYLWADVMAADVASAFAESPGGLYDSATAARWRNTLLSVGHRVPADKAFRNFRGRDPDPLALLRRFDLDALA